MATSGIWVDQRKDLKIGVRGDSLLSTRHDLAKKKAFRSFKSEFMDNFTETFGPCFIDYDLSPDQVVRDISKKILAGINFDVLCVGVGMNDLLEGGSNNIVRRNYPTYLDEDLRQLAIATKHKAPKHLVLIGGPSDVWGYPGQWDAFVARAHQILTDAGVTMVPMAEVANVMRRMKLSHDKLHFAHDDDTREVFAKAWTSWLESYAGLTPVDPATLPSYSKTGWVDWGQSGWVDYDAKKAAKQRKREELQNIVERKMGVRTDSLLNTRANDKKKSWKTFKGGFCEQWWETFGPCNVDYDVSNNETIRDVIAAVNSAPSFEVLCVGIGINDLLVKSWAKNEVKHEWPQHLDQDLAELAAAIKGKAEKHLVIVGGPASVWNHPYRWDRFIERAYQLLNYAGVVTVPLADVASVMMQMPLSFDGFHFAHSDENKALFGKTVTSWLLKYANVEPKGGGVKRPRQ